LTLTKISTAVPQRCSRWLAQDGNITAKREEHLLYCFLELCTHVVGIYTSIFNTSHQAYNIRYGLVARIHRSHHDCSDVARVRFPVSELNFFLAIWRCRRSGGCVLRIAFCTVIWLVRKLGLRKWMDSRNTDITLNELASWSSLLNNARI
jgi:hypothetical protein